MVKAQFTNQTTTAVDKKTATRKERGERLLETD